MTTELEEKIYPDWSTKGMLGTLDPGHRFKGARLVRKLKEWHTAKRITGQEMAGLANEAASLGLLSAKDKARVLKYLGVAQ